MKFCPVFFYLLFTFISFGQNTIELNEKFDALAKNIRQSTYYDSSAVFVFGDLAIDIAQELKDLSKESLIYQYYGNYYYFSGNQKRASIYYKKSKDLALKNNDITLYNTTLVREAFILSDTDSYAAEEQFQELVLKSKKRGDGQNIIECYNGLGIIAETRSNLKDALRYYILALKQAEKIDSKYHIGMMLNNIGLIKFYNKQYNEAEMDLKRGLKYANELKEERLAFNLHNNLGLIASEQNNYSAALAHYKQTLLKAKSLGFPQSIGIAFLNLSSSYNELKVSDTAILYIDSAITIFNSIGEYHFLPEAYFLKGLIHRSKGNFQQSLSLTDKGLTYAKMISSKSNEASGLKFKSNVLRELGRYKEALDAFESFYDINDSLSQINNAEKMAEMQVLYELEKKNTEIEQLEKDNNLKSYRFNILIVSVTSFIVLFLAFLHNRHVRMRRRQQRDFTQKLITNIDEERSRISRDLHDGIGQSLSLIKSKISLFNQQKTENIVGLDHEIGEIINQTRSISHGLHPSYLEKIGLVRSVASLMERIQKSTGIICSYDIDEESESLDIVTQSQLYRIVQELTNNTIKHANASALKVVFTSDNEYHTFEYMDNGGGYTENELAEGIGINTIRERALKIGGKVYFTDKKGRGFKSTIRFEK